MSSIHITDIEAAINYWRNKDPSKDGITLSSALRSLAHVYALMVHFHEEEVSINGFPSPVSYTHLTLPTIYSV